MLPFSTPFFFLAPTSPILSYLYFSAPSNSFSRPSASHPHSPLSFHYHFSLCLLSVLSDILMLSFLFLSFLHSILSLQSPGFSLPFLLLLSLSGSLCWSPFFSFLPFLPWLPLVFLPLFLLFYSLIFLAQCLFLLFFLPCFSCYSFCLTLSPCFSFLSFLSVDNSSIYLSKSLLHSF